VENSHQKRAKGLLLCIMGVQAYGGFSAQDIADCSYKWQFASLTAIKLYANF